MKITTRVVFTLLIFTLSFFLFYLLADKTEYQTFEDYIEEPRVYITTYGECYHSDNCQFLSQSKIARGLYDAESNGYRACSYCKGTPFATIEVIHYKLEEIDVADEVAVESILFASFCTVVFMPIVNHLKRISDT